MIGSSPCGCLRLPIQAIGQQAELDQLGLAGSAAFQLFPKNDLSPVRIGSYGDGGSVGQENTDGSQANGGNRGRDESVGVTADLMPAATRGGPSALPAVGLPGARAEE